METKLLFAFDLEAKELDYYVAIEDWLNETFGQDGFLKILNTTYVVKTPLSCNDFVSLLIGESLIDNSDSCFCQRITQDCQGCLTDPQRNFIGS